MEGNRTRFLAISACSILTSIALEYPTQAWAPMVVVMAALSGWSAQREGARAEKHTGKEIILFTLFTVLSCFVSLICAFWPPFFSNVICAALLALTPTQIVMLSSIQVKHLKRAMLIAAPVAVVGVAIIVVNYAKDWTGIIPGIVLLIDSLAVLGLGIWRVQWIKEDTAKSSRLSWTSMVVVIICTVLSGVVMDMGEPDRYTPAEWMSMMRRNWTAALVLFATGAWSLYCIRKCAMVKKNPRAMLAVAATLTIIALIATALRGSTRTENRTGSYDTGACLLLLLYSSIMLMMVLSEEAMLKQAKIISKGCYVLLIACFATNILPMYLGIHFVPRRLDDASPPFYIFTVLLIVFTECRLHGAARGFLHVGITMLLISVAFLGASIVSSMRMIRELNRIRSQHPPEDDWMFKRDRDDIDRIFSNFYFERTTHAFFTATYICLASGYKSGYERASIAGGYALLLTSEVAAFTFYLRNHNDYLGPVSIMSIIFAVFFLSCAECSNSSSSKHTEGLCRLTIVLQLAAASAAGVGIVGKMQIPFIVFCIVTWLLFNVGMSACDRYVKDARITTKCDSAPTVKKRRLKFTGLILIAILIIALLFLYDILHESTSVIVPFTFITFSIIFALGVRLIFSFEKEMMCAVRSGVIVFVLIFYLVLIATSLKGSKEELLNQLFFAAAPTLALVLQFIVYSAKARSLNKKKKDEAAATTLVTDADAPVVVDLDSDSALVEENES